MPKAISNRRLRPLYRLAVYGIRNIKITTEAISFNDWESKRRAKNSGMVALDRCWVMMRVRRPSTAQASSEPITALPRPTQVAAMPNFQPNWPA